MHHCHRSKNAFLPRFVSWQELQSAKSLVRQAKTCSQRRLRLGISPRNLASIQLTLHGSHRSQCEGELHMGQLSGQDTRTACKTLVLFDYIPCVREYRCTSKDILQTLCLMALDSWSGNLVSAMARTTQQGSIY